MAKTASRELRHVAARDVGRLNAGRFAFANDMAERAAQVAALVNAPQGLERLGISGINPYHLQRMVAGVAAMDAQGIPAFNPETFGMDALQPTITTPSVSTPIQFLQFWLPGFIGIITAARKIDEILGISTVGDWADEEVVQGTLEPVGVAALYGDYTNVPLASWNVNFEGRTIVRFEQGMRAGVLEEARAGKVNINSAESKRNAATQSLEINRNTVGFYGYNSGLGRTFGFLNDPGLTAAIPFPDGTTPTASEWATKDFAEIQADIRLMISTLRVQSQDTIDPKRTQLTLVLPTSVVDYLSTTTDQGVSVQDWMDKAYPNIRVVSAPQMEDAISNENAAYLFAENVNPEDDKVSTDDRRTWLQAVPAKFRLIGVSQMTKGYEEDYSNATAGVLLKRSYAVVRFYGC